MDITTFRQRFRGVMGSTVTPFSADLSVDHSGIKTNVEYLLEHGIKVIVPGGSVGEFSSLSVQERKDVIASHVEAVAGRAMVVAGAGDTDVATVVDLARSARASGADGVMVVAPFYFKLHPEEFAAFFERIDAEVACPWVLYNNPSATKADVPLPVIGRLGQLPWFGGVKEANPAPLRFYNLVRRAQGRYPIIAAAEAPILFLIIAGAAGTLTVSSAFAPDLFRELVQRIDSRDLDRAYPLYERLLDFRQPMEAEIADGYPAFVQYTKAAVRLLGLPAGPVRPPLRDLSAEQVSALGQSMEKYLGLKIPPKAAAS